MAKKRDYILDDIHRTPDVTHIQNPDVSHEKSDVNVRSIIIFAAGLLVFGIIVQVLMWLLFNYMEDRARKAEPPPRPMALSEKERIPPPPRLQLAPSFGVDPCLGKQPSNPDQDIRINLQLKEPSAEYKELREIWDDELKGQPDPCTGQASMPINEAMQKVLQSGQLQSRPPTTGQQTGEQQQIDINGGMNIPSYQSSGRMTEKRDQ